MHHVKAVETAAAIQQTEVEKHDIDAAQVQEIEARLEPINMVHLVRDLPGAGQITSNEEGVVGIIFDEQNYDRIGIHKCFPTLRPQLANPGLDPR
jgi:hypothetical protein